MAFADVAKYVIHTETNIESLKMKTARWNETAPELKPDYFDFANTCLVLAPHADDETLGCGGLICLLRERHKEVFVLFITDGSASHPASKQYHAELLSALRKEEAMKALQVLGVPQSNAFFLNKKDGALPAEGTRDFEQNANQLHLLITLLAPDLVLIPYEKDPHRDHRATWQMLMHSNKEIHTKFRILQYVIWLHERGEEEDMPGDNSICFIDITKYKALKEKAIEQHQSQTTTLIDDDPNGFILSPEVLAKFIINKEFYIEQSL
ncbi:MAG: PIG-L family deacetylase [Bacteroidota bacterium]|nr:PIG-L family deacetylase [Bacteroidota bacterium]